MIAKQVLQYLLAHFEEEIENKIKVHKDSIEIYLNDGTKAILSTKEF